MYMIVLPIVKGEYMSADIERESISKILDIVLNRIDDSVFMLEFSQNLTKRNRRGREFLNLVQRQHHVGDVDRLELENTLAWGLGYNVIVG